MSETPTRIELSQVMSNQQTNLLGTVHGGNIMKFVDDAAGAAAARYCGGSAVTAAMDEMLFLAPVRVGDILTVKAQVNWAGRTSVEVGVRVETTRWDDLSPAIHVATAYLVMVAVDAHGKPRPVPPLHPTTDEDKRRYRAAEIRREHRLARREAIRELGAGEASVEQARRSV